MTEGFGQLIASTDPAMVVVTVAADGEVDGCLVGFHSQCSIDPPRHAVWLSVANRTYALARRASHLAVHRLGSGDRDVAELFGGVTGDDVDKLAGCAWQPGPSGVPLLERCPARFVGRITEHVAGTGDHAMFVLDVVEATTTEPSTDVLRMSSVADLDPGHDPRDRR